MSAELTPADYAFLIFLRDAGRELSNTEMEKRYHVRLVGAAYAKLNSDGYVESNTKKRPYTHRLTTEGNKAVIAYLRPDFGVALKPAERAVWAAMVLLAKGSVRPAAAPEPVDVEDRIRAAYAELAAERGDWVDLTALRPKLADVAKADLDKALEQMLDSPDVQVEPEPFGHRIGAAERAAAVHIGGEDRHKLAIGLR
jgi:hypothetical protein